MLRPGGMLLYSTCTFSPLENEDNLKRLLEAEPELEIVPLSTGDWFRKDSCPERSGSGLRMSVEKGISQLFSGKKERLVRRVERTDAGRRSFRKGFPILLPFSGGRS